VRRWQWHSLSLSVLSWSVCLVCEQQITEDLDELTDLVAELAAFSKVRPLLFSFKKVIAEHSSGLPKLVPAGTRLSNSQPGMVQCTHSEDASNTVPLHSLASLAFALQESAVIIGGAGSSGRIAFMVARACNAVLLSQGRSPCFQYLIAGGDEALLRVRPPLSLPPSLALIGRTECHAHVMSL